MDIQDNSIISKFLGLIRFSINPESAVPEGIMEHDWPALLEIAKMQALVGVLWNGVERLPKEMYPDPEIVLKWCLAKDRIKKRNIYINNLAVELCNKLRSDGVQCCLLKGQGNAIMYPDVYSRMPGDIDLWGGADRQTLMDYVKRKFCINEVNYYHIGFEYGKEVPVELHYVLVTLNNWFYNRRLQKWLQRISNAEYTEKVCLPYTNGQIMIPTVEYNCVYQLAHISEHFFGNGIGFRQMMDYFYLMRNLPDEKRDMKEWEKTLKYLGMYRFACAVMYVLKEAFGLEEKYMIVKPNEKSGKILLDEVIDGGNFGSFYSKYGSFVNRGTLMKFLLKFIRTARFVRAFPSEALSEPLFRIWHLMWRVFVGSKLK